MFGIFYHPAVSDEDFKRMPENDRQRILRTIHKKLTLDPFVFGKPLTGNLKGYHRLRIDPYRVIYTIEKERILVFIIKIGLQKDLMAYLEAAKRLGLVK